MTIAHLDTYAVKRKWERIVNRGFEKSQAPPDAVSRRQGHTIEMSLSDFVRQLPRLSHDRHACRL